MPEVIQFYEAAGPHGYLSNHSPHPISLQGKTWPTTEHYFQAQKFAGLPHAEAIRQAATSQQAAEMGRDRSQPLRADWGQIKDALMREALRAKFTQHAGLGGQLLATGHAHLIEHTETDSYWGDGGDGSGANQLGKLLMEIREELRQGA